MNENSQKEQVILQLVSSLDEMSQLNDACNAINDDAMYAYVAGKLSSKEGNDIKKHCAECIICKKALLRLRANYISRNTEEQKQSSKQFSLHKVFSTIFSACKRWRNYKVPLWSAIAATLLITSTALIVLESLYLKKSYNELASTDIQVTKSSDIALAKHSKDHMRVSQSQSAWGSNINWYEGNISAQASAIGHFNDAKDKKRVEEKTTLYAEKLAHLKIFASLQKIYIDPKNFVDISNEKYEPLLLRTMELLESGEAKQKHVTRWSKNQVEVSVGIRIPLYGEAGFGGLLNKSIPISRISTDKKNDTQNSRANAMTAKYAMPDTSATHDNVSDNGNLPKIERYSGVIFNAKGLNYMPSLLPMVVTDTNETLYLAKIKLAAKEKQVAYYSSLQEALHDQVSGVKPLTIRVKSVKDNGVLIVDSQEIKGVNLESLKSGEARISIVF